MSLRVLLLSTEASLPSRCLQVDADGLILDSVEVTPAQPLPETFASSATRNVVVVPGIEVRALWLDLPAHNPVQALAAARLLLEEHIAGPREALHIAIAPRQLARTRLVAVVERDTLHDWLRRAATLGVAADAMVPDHLLPAVVDDGALGNAEVVVCSVDGRWIVRGPALAFSTEAALAQQVLGERHYQVIEDTAAVDALMAAGAGNAPIDLLQYDFARNDASRSEGPNRRSLALLALALLLSPVVLVLAQALRYEIAARALVRQATAIAAPLVATDSSGDLLAALRLQQRMLEAPQAMDNLRRSLFDAVAASGGARLDAFEYTDAGSASATVVHITPAQVQDLRALLEQRGIRTGDGGSTPVDDGLRTRLTLESDQ